MEGKCQSKSKSQDADGNELLKMQSNAARFASIINNEHSKEKRSGKTII